MRRYYLTYILIVLIYFSDSYGQENYSFDHFLSLALANNLDLKEASYNQDITTVELEIKKNDFYPTFNANLSSRNAYGRSIDPYSNSFVDSQFKSYSGGVSSNLILFNGLSKLNGLKLAKNELLLSQTIYEKIKKDITIELAKLYTSILFTEEIVRATSEQIQLSLEQLEFLKLKFLEGLISESELFRKESQISEEQFELANEKSNLDMLYLDLEHILNDSGLKRNSLRALNLKLIDENLENSVLIEEVYENSSLYQIAKIKEENSKIAIDISRANKMPSLSLQLNYNSFYSDSNSEYTFSKQWENNKNYGFSFVLSVPIFNGFLIKKKIKKEKIIYNQAKIRTKIEKNNLEKILKQVNIDFITLKTKLSVSEKALRFSEKTYQADLIKFEYGKLSLSTLLISQKNYYQNQATLIKAKYEYIFSKALLGFYANNIMVLN